MLISGSCHRVQYEHCFSWQNLFPVFVAVSFDALFLEVCLICVTKKFMCEVKEQHVQQRLSGVPERPERLEIAFYVAFVNVLPFYAQPFQGRIALLWKPW